MSRPVHRLALAMAVAGMIAAAQAPGQTTGQAPAQTAGETAGQTVPEPDDYRMEDYRAPVPDSVAWGRVLDDFDALEQHEIGTVFIDVMPRIERPPGLPEDTLWIDRERLSIPGALYAPNVGYGRLNAETDRYFRHVMALATGGDLGVPVVIFCQAECWMSWNAARRAMIDYGYVEVQWYPDGADGWVASGGTLEVVEPVPRPE